MKGLPSTGPGTIKPSFTPNITWTDLSLCLPEFATIAIKEALPVFDRRIKGFANPHAILTGVETRSSSPIRISRDQEYKSNITGLYPAGEGAGYAGGITSAAVDGIQVAEAIISQYKY